MQSTRLPGWDYASPAHYFVTICTKNHECFFGDVVDGSMRLSPIGEIVAEEWQRTPLVRRNVVLDRGSREASSTRAGQRNILHDAIGCTSALINTSALIQVMDLCRMDARPATYQLKKMVGRKLLTRRGVARGTFYVLAETSKTDKHTSIVRSC